MRNALRAVAQTTAVIGYAAYKTARHVANAVYSPTVQTKTAQGATELSNALFGQATAYSPVTADKAADNAHRAQFQNRLLTRGMER